MFFLRPQLTKISLTVLAVLVVGFLFVRQPIGITFANGGLFLTIDSYSIYNGVYQEALSWNLKNLVPGVDKFFNFNDIKPGDSGEHTISLHVDGSDAYVCLDFTNLTDEENGTNEPESLVDVLPGGELSSGIEFFAWRDDGDNTFEVGERPIFGDTPESAIVVLNDTSYPLADASIDEVFEEGSTHYVGILWCAGELTVDLTSGDVSCSADTLGNAYQTDSMSVDVSLRAVEVSSFTDYTCKDPSIELFMEKKFSGVTLGYTPEQFSFHIFGGEIDTIVPHGGSIDLPIGAYTIIELGPEDFDIPAWRIQWSGDTCTGENIGGGEGFIEVTERDLKKIVSYCRADNQYRPESVAQEDDVDAEENESVVVEEVEERSVEDTGGRRPRGTEWREVDSSSFTLFRNTRTR